MPDATPMNNVTKALALAKLGLKVFPVRTKDRAPLTTNGFYDATSDDIDKIATWFTYDHPEITTEVGVWTGGSGILAADIDKGKANGKDGFASLDTAKRELTDTHNYRTKSGGEHHIWEAGENLDLAPGADVLGMEGVDIRAGGSYIVWWSDDIPANRDVFSADIPNWVLEAATAPEGFDGEGFSDGVEKWLAAVSGNLDPSTRVREFMARIPTRDFAHPEMVELAWELVRLGSERESGIVGAMEMLRDEWLRAPYDTAEYRRDLDLAVKTGINKGGRIQAPMPTIPSDSINTLLIKAGDASDDLKALQTRASKVLKDAAIREFDGAPAGSSEIEFTRIRRDMFKVASEHEVDRAVALGIVVKSTAFQSAQVSFESTWFGDGEPIFRDKVSAQAAIEQAEREADDDLHKVEIELTKMSAKLSADAAKFTFLTKSEQAKADKYDWWGKDYLDLIRARLKHFNKPYHVSAMWAVLSTIVAPWGKLKSQGGRPENCNLYIAALGVSTSGKSESMVFATDMLDAYFGRDEQVILGDINKLSPLALHRALVQRDKQPSMVYGDEIQAFFQNVSTTQWQQGTLGDLSNYYGGDVPAKQMLNDKDISGQRAETILTAYLTGIGEQTLDALSLNHWTNGLFLRFLWSFGEPRQPNDHKIDFNPPGQIDYKVKFEEWAREFRVRGERADLRRVMNPGQEPPEIDWTPQANARLNKFSERLEDEVAGSVLYDDVFVAANLRFLTSIMKCATLVALAEDSSVVTLDHLLVAMDYAGPWHRSMVLAVSETGTDPFIRECQKVLVWIKRNATKQDGKMSFVQRAQVMRQVQPNEVADRILRQLTEEGRLIRSGDKYEVVES